MQVNLNVCVAHASLSADPVVTFLNKVRQAAYANHPNPVKTALKKVNPDHTEDLNLVVFGIPSLTSKDPIGFAVEDPVDNSVVTSYLKGAASAPNGRVTSTHSDEVKLANVPLSMQRCKIFMRMPLDAL